MHNPNPFWPNQIVNLSLWHFNHFGSTVLCLLAVIEPQSCSKTRTASSKTNHDWRQDSSAGSGSSEATAHHRDQDYNNDNWPKTKCFPTGWLIKKPAINLEFNAGICEFFGLISHGAFFLSLLDHVNIYIDIGLKIVKFRNIQRLWVVLGFVNESFT